VRAVVVSATRIARKPTPPPPHSPTTGTGAFARLGYDAADERAFRRAGSGHRMSLHTDAELHRLAEALGERFRQQRLTLVTAESCTGGWIAKTVTDIAGSSDWFDSGMVAYSYEAKQAMLGVRPETLEYHGAVSRETVIEMVSGALVHSGGAVAVAVTGIAGPGGGSADKPVGTVWIGWKRRGGYAKAQVFHFDGDRDAVRRQTVGAALEGLQALIEAS